MVETRAAGSAWRRADGLLVIQSSSVEQDGKLWHHVSLSRPQQLPSYQDMCDVKRTFIGLEETALQVFAPESKHVNTHPYCLHLWSCKEGPVTPDFTQGSGGL
jgi:hypothetical protein